MNAVRMLAIGAVLFAAAVSSSAGEPACPQYLTLKTTNQGTTQDVLGSTYAYGWFGVDPRGNGTRFHCCDHSAWHKGYYGDCWLWWYK